MSGTIAIMLCSAQIILCFTQITLRTVRCKIVLSQNTVKVLRIDEETQVEDKGSEGVTQTKTRKDGSTVEKSENRCFWAVKPTDLAGQQGR